MLSCGELTSPTPTVKGATAARVSITFKPSALNRSTSFFARIGPMPLTSPLPRYRSIPSTVVGGTVFRVVALGGTSACR